MSTRTRRSPLARLHTHTQAPRRARRLRTRGSLGLDPEQAAWEAKQRAARYPVGHFGPQHGLTIAQAWLAQQLLNRANRLRPIRGRHAERRHRLRIGGIISAVLGGRGRQQCLWPEPPWPSWWPCHGHARAAHLAEIAPLGAKAAQAARERKHAQEVWERTGEVLPIGLGQQASSQTPEEARLATLQEQWQQQNWMQYRNFLAW